MRQYAGFGSAAQTNARWKKLLELGQTGLSCAFDLPTQLGLDSDNPEALGEVGRTGVAIDSLADMEILFDGIPMGKTSTSMTINAPTITILAMFAACAEKQGVDIKELRGTVQNDILKEFAARKAFIFSGRTLHAIDHRHLRVGQPEHPALQHDFNLRPTTSARPAPPPRRRSPSRSRTPSPTWTRQRPAAWISSNSRHRCPSSSRPNVDLFEEVAKFRAARRMWAKIIKERFGIDNPKAQLLRFHTQTGGSTLQAQEIDNNIVRTAISALAAVMGGTQSLHTNSRDEALRPAQRDLGAHRPCARSRSSPSSPGSPARSIRWPAVTWWSR